MTRDEVAIEAATRNAQSAEPGIAYLVRAIEWRGTGKALVITFNLSVAG